MNKKAQNLKSQMTQISKQMQLIRSALTAEGWACRKKHKQASLYVTRGEPKFQAFTVTCYSHGDWRITSFYPDTARCDAVGDCLQHCIQEIVNDATTTLKEKFRICGFAECDALAQRGLSR